MSHPVDIRPIEKDILITWNDDHRSLLSCRELRYLCPCAHCVDEWSGKRVIAFDEVDPGIELQESFPVGRYGVKFRWSDGHSTGIYSFQYLRSMCHCVNCNKSEGEQ